MLDSLQTVELIVRLSATLCIAISPAEFDREAWATPAAMVADIERRVREGGDGQANGSTS
jgi:D-alanine--poly(phosphoribitol) ligase subunit 2